MKKILGFVGLTMAFAGGALAQLTPLPPSSTTNGVVVQPIGVNAGPTHWDSLSSIGSYKISSDATVALPNPFGLTWAPTVSPNAALAKTNINLGGGSIQGIFIGESAMWLNDFGYTYSGTPAGPNSYTLIENIRAGGPTSTFTFGDNFRINFAPGTAANFDFWYNSTGTTDPNGSNSLGGTYTAFNPANSSPIPVGGPLVMWAQNPIMVNTWVASLNAYVDVATYIVAFEDWRFERGSDADYTDFIIGLQFFNAQGTPFTPVPEPSTYGVIGAIGLLAMVGYRRLKKTGMRTSVI
jgi:hypothetical protein